MIKVYQRIFNKPVDLVNRLFSFISNEIDDLKQKYLTIYNNANLTNKLFVYKKVNR
jgi:hypothetical protein